MASLKERFQSAVDAFRKGQNPIAVTAKRSKLGGLFTSPMARLPDDAIDVATVERTNPTIGRAVAVLAEACATIPLRLVRESTDRKTHTPVLGQPALEVWEHINPYETPTNFFITLYKDLITLGNNYTHFVLDDVTGDPLSCWRLPAHQTKPIPHETRIISGYQWTNEIGDEQRYKVDEVLHFKTANQWDPYVGYPALDRLRGTIVLEKQMRRFQYNRFLNEISSSLIFFTERDFANDEELEEATEYIHRKFAGSQNARKPIILSGESWELKTIDKPTDDDMALLAGLKFLRAEIAMVLGVPPTKLSDFSDSFRSTAKEQDRSFYEDTVMDWHKIVLDTLNTVFLPRYYGNQQRLRFVYDYSGVKALAPSEFEQAQVQELLTRSGIRSVNEARTALGDDERPEAEADQLMYQGTKLGEAKETGSPKKPVNEPDDSDSDLTRRAAEIAIARWQDGETEQDV